MSISSNAHILFFSNNILNRGFQIALRYAEREMDGGGDYSQEKFGGGDFLLGGGNL